MGLEYLCVTLESELQIIAQPGKNFKKQPFGDCLKSALSTFLLILGGVMRKQNLFLLVSTMFLLSVSTFAKTNFSGTWKMNIQKSDPGCPCRTGTFSAPEEALRTVKQKGSVILVSLVQNGSSGKLQAELTYLADGSRCTNELGDCRLVSEARWDGNDLVVKSHLETDPDIPDWEDRWTLSEDGKILTIKRDPCSISGLDCQKFVFDRLELTPPQ